MSGYGLPYPAACGRQAKEGYGKPHPYSLRSIGMATVVVSTYKVASYPEGGGHFWVYMQYVQGLQRLGCDVYWLENCAARATRARTERGWLSS